ncbi:MULTISPECIES: glycerol-3-phosphate dehydrogenase/oxidase [Pontibacillus]|uniref:Glycerol-3-phosphate dehydrogenase n=1 Tax=Pontibacillus chungwhensis TaxID=265426 RepID=A0ABY8UV71_9BACI|nr:MULTISPECIES: glycerol-3-phosphate dehydrogenase/oxidase [Pontibacillus]MCD5325325.1 glycerol-3-phosphate dehydrogenase/oxidase [Pontibacillus sp. HN14]WIF97566.1 glycerol-3-phosphate dehydrogenase/oxidase [Pontibacillus chungwhensis]
MKTFSSLQRNEIYNEMEKETLDVLVIGGGITGAGIALDSATRGLTTGVLEMQDFAAGTSSRSTKLVHGGLRYLKQFQVAMVAEVGKERDIVYQNGPHVTTPEWMLLPFHKGGNFGPFSTNVGLRVYDYLAGVKKSERRKMLSAKETLKREPLVKRNGLKGGGYYVEYRTDDARLTLEVMKKAVQKGAQALNYTKVVDFLYEEGKVKGVEVEDQLSGERRHLYAKKIVNAGGPWVDTLREKDGSKKGKTLQLTKGVHLVFDQQTFPLQQAIYFDTPDDRMVFAIPRDGKTYVGTTDTVYEGEIAHPKMTVDDRDYILSAIDYMFPSLSITANDVESSWAGLRPLIHEEGKDPSEISRKDEIFESESGLISIAGGKLTGYRKMAENVINLVTEQLKDETGKDYPKSQTKELPISGGEVGGAKGFQKFKERKTGEGIAYGLTEEQARGLVQLYGANVGKVFEYFQNNQDEAEREGVDPLVFAMLKYGIEYELTAKPVDFFIRRTGALFFDIHWVHKHKESVIAYMARTFNWTDEQIDIYIYELIELLEEAVTPIPAQ